MHASISGSKQSRIDINTHLFYSLTGNIPGASTSDTWLDSLSIQGVDSLCTGFKMPTVHALVEPDSEKDAESPGRSTKA